MKSRKSKELASGKRRSGEERQLKKEGGKGSQTVVDILRGLEEG